METVGSMLSRTEVICGILSLLGAAFGYLTVRFTAARERANSQLEIEKAAQEARAKVKVEAEKNAVDAWHGIAGEYKRQVNRLTVQNADQQRQLDALKAQHEDCEKRHGVLEYQVAALQGTVTKITGGSK